EVLAHTGLPAEVLELEITENVALEDENAIMPLQQLYARGVRLALDDFGTGYASLNCLTRFPLSRIKVDRHFVTHITDDGEDGATGAWRRSGALEGARNLQVVKVAPHRGDRQHFPAAVIVQDTVAIGDFAVDLDAVPGAGVSGIADRLVVVLAPKERRVDIAL